MDIDPDNFKKSKLDAAKKRVFQDTQGTAWEWVVRPKNKRGGPYYIKTNSKTKPISNKELDELAVKNKLFKIYDLKAKYGMLKGEVHRIAIESEQNDCWKGRPVSNPDCILCTFPKKIWEIVNN